RDDDPQRPQHAQHAWRGTVQLVAYRELELADVGAVLRLPDSGEVGEGADRRGGESASPEPGDRRHARVVPTAYVSTTNQLEQPPLAEHGVVEVPPGELVLPGPTLDGDVLDHPVVERPVVLELHRADGVSHALQRVLDRVGEVVERIDSPAV